MTIGADQLDTLIFPGDTPLQVVVWSGKRRSVTTTVVSQRITLPVGTSCLEIISLQDCFLAFGDETVVADMVIADDASRIFIAGMQIIPVPRDSSGVLFTHLAVIKGVGPGGIFQIEKVS